jgi:hypothetical protein
MFFGTQTVHKDGSFVRMRSDVIKAKCEAMLIAIKSIRQERVKKTIEEGRQRMMQGFWHRLLKKPVPTDDQVKSYLSDGMISETFWDEISFYKNEEVAKKLLNACTYAEEIFVSTEDLERLW